MSFIGAKHLVTPIVGRPIATSEAILVPVPHGKHAAIAEHVSQVDPAWADRRALAGERVKLAAW